jgi:hypothetical protein
MYEMAEYLGVTEEFLCATPSKLYNNMYGKFKEYGQYVIYFDPPGVYKNIDYFKEVIAMKFYQRGWFIWLCLILLPPVGIILLWTQKKYKLIPRIILSVVFLILFIAVVSPGGTDEPSFK